MQKWKMLLFSLAFIVFVTILLYLSMLNLWNQQYDLLTIIVFLFAFGWFALFILKIVRGKKR